MGLDKLIFKKERLQMILVGEAANFNKLLRKVLLSFPMERISSICSGTFDSKLRL